MTNKYVPIFSKRGNLLTGASVILNSMRNSTNYQNKEVGDLIFGFICQKNYTEFKAYK